MIDYFALALGHGLMVLALVHLAMRDGVDADPLIAQIKSETASYRTALTMAGRNAARRMRASGDAGDAGADEAGNISAFQQPSDRAGFRSKAAHR